MQKRIVATVAIAGALVVSGGAAADALTTQGVTNGTWIYGSITNYFSKSCYSQYIYKESTHSATAKLGSTVKVYAAANKWADAKSKGNFTKCCYAYFSNQN